MTGFRSALVSVTLAALLLACGGSVMETGENASGGSGGSAGMGNGGSPQGGSGPGGAAGVGPGGSPAGGSAGAPVDAGPDASPTCLQTNDRIIFEAFIYDGSYFGCPAGPTDGVFEINGAVQEFGGSTFALDSCPPNADCMPMFSKFNFTAPGLLFNIPVGTFVTVRLKVDQPFGNCTGQIEITNLAEWGGVANPFSSQKLIYLSAAHGLAETISGSDILVHRQPLGCIANGPDCGGGAADMYTLYFGAIWQSSLGTPVSMGNTAYWSFKGPNGDQMLFIRNLRSYSTGMCDDYWNWDWFVTQALVGD